MSRVRPHQLLDFFLRTNSACKNKQTSALPPITSFTTSHCKPSIGRILFSPTVHECNWSRANETHKIRSYFRCDGGSSCALQPMLRANAIWANAQDSVCQYKFQIRIQSRANAMVNGTVTGLLHMQFGGANQKEFD